MSTTTATTGGGGRGWPALPVLLAGVTTGTALLVAAYWAGWRPAIPALPPLLASLAGAAAAWLVFTAVASAAAGLLARHHRTLTRHAARGAGRASLAAARGVGKGSRATGGWLAARAARRWQGRRHQPLMFTRASDPAAQAQPDIRQPIEQEAGETRMDEKVEQDVKRQVCAMHTEDQLQPDEVIVNEDGTVIIDRRRKYPWAKPVSAYRWLRQPAAAATAQPPSGTGSTGPVTLQGDQPMTAPAGPPPGPAAGRGAVRATAPDQWKALVAATADFEPEDDGQLLEWMAAEVAGMSAYAEALAEVYETCVNSLGVDPAAMNAVHDTADAAAEAATAMAYARQRFAAHYAEVREFAAAGGLLPFDGRWITGDGDT